MSLHNVSRRGVTALVIGIFSLLGAGTLVGQSPFAPSAGPFDRILAKLEALQTAVEDLATTPAEPSAVTLRTSPAIIFGSTQAFATCNVTNVTPSPLSITVTLLDSGGAAVANPLTTSLAAGQSGSIGVPVNSVSTQRRRCEFSFTGFPDDVRANLTVGDNDADASAVMSVFEAR